MYNGRVVIMAVISIQGLGNYVLEWLMPLHCLASLYSILHRLYIAQTAKQSEKLAPLQSLD